MDNSPDTTLLLATAVQETWIVLHGAGAACGSIAGRARVLVMPDDVSQLQPGEILVVSSATKGWEPACACAAAMVGDSGGMLCTLARRARQAQIPAVFGTTQATTVIQTGDLLAVDGATGTVWIRKAAVMPGGDSNG